MTLLLLTVGFVFMIIEILSSFMSDLLRPSIRELGLVMLYFTKTVSINNLGTMSALFEYSRYFGLIFYHSS